MYHRCTALVKRNLLELDEENAFEAQGVFPGKYTFRVHAHWKDAERNRNSSPPVTTDPREITIEVVSKERVTQDITITKIEGLKQE